LTNARFLCQQTGNAKKRKQVEEEDELESMDEDEQDVRPVQPLSPPRHVKKPEGLSRFRARGPPPT
jgi:hypothetical protein